MWDFDFGYYIGFTKTQINTSFYNQFEFICKTIDTFTFFNIDFNKEFYAL